MARYVALIDGKKGAYGVVFPDCPGCTAMGRTVDEAMRNAGEALAEWAAEERAAGRAVPSPRTVDATRADRDVAEALADGAVLALATLVLDSGKSARANVSLDSGLLAAIDEAAHESGVTRSAFLSAAAREKIAAG
jgi:predicted RNase H-like HicB family nuclease